MSYQYLSFFAELTLKTDFTKLWQQSYTSLDNDR